MNFELIPQVFPLQHLTHYATAGKTGALSSEQTTDMVKGRQMADPRELRNRRLENEFKELMRINGTIIQIAPLGRVPYEKYRITFHVRTIISSTPTYRDSTTCILSIPPGYPKDPPPARAPRAWRPSSRRRAAPGGCRACRSTGHALW